MNRESTEATNVKSGLSKKLGVKPAPMLARETKKNALKEASRVRKETIEWGMKQPWAQRVMKNIQHASDRGEYSTSIYFNSGEEALRAEELFSRLGYRTSIEDYWGSATLYISWK